MDKDRCPTQFTAERREILRTALLAAYADADEVCDPDRGFNDLLHGQIVYHLIGFRLQRAFEDDSEVRYSSHGLGPEIHVGPLRLRWNKVGRSSSERIDSSFPRASRVASNMAEANQQLLLWSGSEDGVELTSWILAHIGNPRDGLIRAYLAAPVDNSGIEVTAWSQWVAMYDASQPQIDLPEAPAPGLPVAAEIGPIDVSLLEEPHLRVINE